MISRFHIQNFKCLLDVDVELGPFTVLIGPNDSGKSSLLEAMYLLGQTATHSLQEVFAGHLAVANLVSRKDPNRLIVWRVHGTGADGHFTYRVDLPPSGNTPRHEQLSVGKQVLLRVAENAGQQSTVEFMRPGEGSITGRLPFQTTGLRELPNQRRGEQTLLSVARALATSPRYQFEPDLLRQEADLEANPVLKPRGENLAVVLDGILRTERSAINELEAVLRKTIPTLSGISLPVTPEKRIALHFTLAGNSSSPVIIPATLVSDGALLVTAFLALAYGDTPDILLIEEPENGLHYSNLKLVIDLLRKISRGEVGNRPRQVIISTHSPLLLNFIEPEEVRIFERPENGGTQVKRMSDVPDIDKLLEEFGTGELWYMLGEGGLLKGAQP